MLLICIKADQRPFPGNVVHVKKSAHSFLGHKLNFCMELMKLNMKYSLRCSKTGMILDEYNHDA